MKILESVKRYDIVYGEKSQENDGEWVKYADYEKLEAFAKAIAEQSLAKYIVNCNTCANRNKVNGLSGDLFCDSCIHATKWKVSHFKPLPEPPKDYP